MNNVIPFPAARIYRLHKFGRLADYCGLQVQVLAEGGPNALVEYDGKRGWVAAGSLREYERVYEGLPSDSEPAA